MKSAVLALIDCNNFFVSCERIFRPDLNGRAVVVLSSNDGCAVARSNEAKAIGIPMGAPAFKYREIFEKHKVIKFSANFELYGDMSRRIVQILTSFTPRTEIYSIDEAFMDLSELDIQDYAAWGREVRNRIWREVGIPVSVGIAPTKTLAKLATELVKKDPGTDGALSFIKIPSEDLALYRRGVPLQDVWGIGWRNAPKLKALGMSTAQDVAEMRPQLAQKLFGIRGRQLAAELNGIACFGLESLDTRPKSISRTRTFGEDTNQIYVLEAAIASFAAQAAYKLRVSGQLATRAGLFIMTNKHKPGFRGWTKEIKLDAPTADSGLLARLLVDALSTMFSRNNYYHRAGVWLVDFVPENNIQTDILNIFDAKKHGESAVRMAAIDQTNARYGKRTLRFAAEDLAQSWQPVRRLRSPRYVSDWEELPIVRPKSK